MSDQVAGENLTRAVQDGTLVVNGERAILTSASVFGTLRRDLMENLGPERARGFLLRYGWNLGANDALRVQSRAGVSLEDLLRQGPVLHMMRGYTRVQTSRFDLNLDEAGRVHSVYVEGRWRDSYEAQEHVRQFGIAREPVCHTLAGYASGYYSTICGQDVVFRETACQAMGAQTCTYVGKTVQAWMGEADEELRFYKNEPIVLELKKLHDQTSFEARERTKGHWFDRLLSDPDAASGVAALCKTFGLSADANGVVAVVRMQGPGPEHALFLYDGLITAVRRSFRDGLPSLVTHDGPDIVLWLQASEQDIVKASCENLGERLHREFPGCHFRLGISAPRTGFLTTAAAFQEARTALLLTTDRRPMLTYSELGLVSLLAHSEQPEVVLQWAQRYVGSLLDDKVDPSHELLRTLYAFLDHGGNLERTMGALSMSMSGLRYRLAKIETVLGQNLRDPAVHHQLYLALQVLVVLGDLTLEENSGLVRHR